VLEFLSHPAGGMESSPGKKDRAKVRAFINAAKLAA
jgi:phosphoribosylanthranilate isomerase